MKPKSQEDEEQWWWFSPRVHQIGQIIFEERNMTQQIAGNSKVDRQPDTIVTPISEIPLQKAKNNQEEGEEWLQFSKYT